MKLKPTPGHLLIEPLEKEVKTASGIYLPDNSTEKPQMGKVIAVGKNTYFENHEISSPAKLGETVLYKKWGGNEVKLGGKEYMIVKFEDILAVQEKPMTLKDVANEIRNNINN